MSKISEKVEALCAPVIAGLGLELWDVEYAKEAGDWYLRIYIDKDGGVAINDCEAVSHALDDILDAADPIPGPYIFEVSSAGAERALKRPGDFERFIGHTVMVKLYRSRDGRKEFNGRLQAYESGDIRLETDAGELFFKKDDVALVRLSID